MVRSITPYQLAVAGGLIILTSAFLRLLQVLPSLNPLPPPKTRRRQSPTRLLVVLGSGGHTAEMLALLRNLDCTSYTHRSYVVSPGDDFSARRAREFESAIAREGPCTTPSTYDICSIPRARAIHQPLFTTPLSTLRCLVACFRVLRSPSTYTPKSTKISASSYGYPDLILSNGPGTAVCVIFAAMLIRFFSPLLPGTLQPVIGERGGMRTIYIESWARVKGLSLSGKILVWVVDRFLVQWEGLRGVGGRGEYIGVLV